MISATLFHCFSNYNNIYKQWSNKRKRATNVHCNMLKHTITNTIPP